MSKNARVRVNVAGSGVEAPLEFRPDVDGLRAVAIVMVVAFHLGVPGFGGGFVGVDVFFVLSGFLILRLLLKESEQTGSIHLAAFWARRARRLLPAAAVVVFTVAIVAPIILPVALRVVGSQVIAAGTYLSNVYFQIASEEYFNDQTAGPLLHTWSLSVEEQFYVVIPLLLTIAIRGARPSDVRLRVGLLLLLIGVASVVGCEMLSRAGHIAAFYSAPARAWEFCAGGLIAVVEPYLRRPRLAAFTTAGTALGIVLLVAALALSGGARFPGPVTGFAVVGTVSIIAGGVQPSRATRVLSFAVLQYIGRLSYSLYLVHWPIHVAMRLLVPDAPTGVGAVGAGLASGLAAVALHRFVEKPLRFHPFFAQSPLRPLVAAVALACVAVVAGIGLRTIAQCERRPKSGSF